VAILGRGGYVLPLNLEGGKGGKNVRKNTVSSRRIPVLAGSALRHWKGRKSPIVKRKGWNGKGKRKPFFPQKREDQ